MGRYSRLALPRDQGLDEQPGLLAVAAAQLH